MRVLTPLIQAALTLQIRQLFSSQLELISWKMHSRATMPAYLHMGRLDLENPTQ